MRVKHPFKSKNGNSKGEEKLDREDADNSIWDQFGNLVILFLLLVLFLRIGTMLVWKNKKDLTTCTVLFLHIIVGKFVGVEK